MAEEDDSSKTEDPTSKKLSKAREKGQTVQSQEVKSVAIILAGVMFLMGMAPIIGNRVTGLLTKFIQQPHAMPVDFDHLRFILADVIGDVGLIMAPFFVLMILAALIAGVGQSGLIWATDKIKPKFSNMSLIKGFKKVFSLNSLMELVKGVFKLGIIATIGVASLLPFMTDIALFPDYSVAAFLDRLRLVALILALAALGVMVFIAIIDYAYQKYKFDKQMKMTKQEVKDEHKQSEGDPEVKKRIASLRFERHRQRMMAAVPEADVVITNPTHFAVALKYDMGAMSAPVLVAKGVDNIALKIREIAEENDVPIVANPPLARALYATVELDEEIPGEHYKAVAEVIGYVMGLKGQGPQVAPPAGVDP